MADLQSPDLANVLIALITVAGSLFAGAKAKEALQSKASPPPEKSGSVVEVAGAIVSDRMAAEWVKSADNLAQCVTSLQRTLESNIRALESNTQGAIRVADDIRSVGAPMHELAKEMEVESRLRNRGK